MYRPLQSPSPPCFIQNNNRGGYNVGDRSKDKADGTLLTSNLYDPTQKTKSQYNSVYYAGSQLTVEWTNQHACGGLPATDPQKCHCNIVIQAACETTGNEIGDMSLETVLRDGHNTERPDSKPTYDEAKAAGDANRGLHENAVSYLECTRRVRNKGLFLADQKLNGDAAQYTRQVPTKWQADRTFPFCLYHVFVC